jgi:hypothetical protein
MSRYQLLTWSLAGIGFVAITVAALYYANDWWLSGLVTASILAWLGGMLSAIYGVSERRPFVVGALVASLLYVLFALGPWFRGHVGPWLVTSQALAHVETKWLGRPPSQQLVPVIQPTWTSYPAFTGSGTYTMPGFVYSTGSGYSPMGSSTVMIQQSISLPGRFAEIGHWLFAWIAAALGGLAAVWMSRRQRTTNDGKETA